MGRSPAAVSGIAFELTGPGADVAERSERATLFRLRFSDLFWLPFVLVLSEAVLVLVIDDRMIPGFRFGDAIEFHRHPSQHRDDHGRSWSRSLERPFDYEHEHRRKRLSTSTIVALPERPGISRP